MATRWIAIALSVSIAPAALAEDKAPRPGPETEKLGFFAGKWKTSGELKETPFMPAGKFEGRETCEWFPGKFALVCRMKGKGPTGPTEGLGIMTWSGDEKAYLYYGIDNTPMVPTTLPRGTLAGDTWTYEDESRMGGQMVKSRYVIVVTGKKSYRSSWSILGSDGQWKTVMEGTAIRQ
ncbi:MAG TPA: DUF1579 family protein [Anaeromyxobacteraceae bacterium]|nr:DUF1579 family protein [Anaeromyxobacteraceae bacterium]